MPDISTNENKQMNSQHNFFSYMISKYNDENFIIYLKPEQIQKSAKDRIFREMVKGQIDYSLYGKYFQDTKFLENVLIAARDELNNNTVILNALIFQDINMPGIPEVINMRSRYQIFQFIYQHIVSRLENVKHTGDVGYLVDIQYVLGSYKNYI